jgi:5-methylcytosine-specific restriction endonuclease McrA
MAFWLTCFRGARKQVAKRLALGVNDQMKKSENKPLKWYRETYIKSGYRCAYCGKNLINDFDRWMTIEVDHIVPISRGGSDRLSNRVAACCICNGEKGRYLHPNYRRMTKAQILEAARIHVKSKRSYWHKVYLGAVKEFNKFD